MRFTASAKPRLEAVLSQIDELRPVEVSAADEIAQQALGDRYPAIIKLWENAWPELVPFLQFDTSIRAVVCTTNAIESINARIRRAVNARGHFPTALKCLYMAIMSLDPR